ncbi:hypothetical protein EV385_3325 [Krasilnikovia cinnamomea]|uniref:Uncharacterized protein n=1 Tax=Krasilnikovia cinnamomea TaxID=349313 RepID=A0A4Q7ZMC0_9ACTN|nr:hypothetical protein [Krasilnikovia cinnamomea]RZU51495.1 hypothetical protein EV385_3325 [Krasilnikovia cinnamomea]
MSSHPVDSFGVDTEIDLAIDEQDEGERRAHELATRIRTVAATDPELAQDLVDQLIVALDRAMGGTFREHLDGAARHAADRALAAAAPGATTDGAPRGEAETATGGEPRRAEEATTDGEPPGDTKSKMDTPTSTLRHGGSGAAPTMSSPRNG